MSEMLLEQEEIKSLMELEKDGEWLGSIYREIKEKRRNLLDKFIAVKDRQIIAENEDFQKLLFDLRTKGEDPGSVLIEYIPPEDLMLIL